MRPLFLTFLIFAAAAFAAAMAAYIALDLGSAAFRAKYHMRPLRPDCEQRKFAPGDSQRSSSQRR